jgi:hypothetical protein
MGSFAVSVAWGLALLLRCGWGSLERWGAEICFPDELVYGSGEVFAVQA